MFYVNKNAVLIAFGAMRFSVISCLGVGHVKNDYSKAKFDSISHSHKSTLLSSHLDVGERTYWHGSAQACDHDDGLYG